MLHIKCEDTDLDPVPVKIGIIGGSGLDDPDILEERKETSIDTPFGSPSDALIAGKINGVDCVLLARHGRKHDIMPTNVNYRANIWAMRAMGCTHLIVSTACGSLREEIKPGDLIIPNDFIDRTTKRVQTFYDGQNANLKGVCHLPMYPAYSERTRRILLESAKELNYDVHNKATIVTIEGPRFSSRSESTMFRLWGGDLINMTTCPEIVLAKEAGLLYGSIAIATDYDCWRMGCEGVNVQDVLKTFTENVAKVKQILVKSVSNIAKEDWSEDILDAKECICSNTMSDSSYSWEDIHICWNVPILANIEPPIHAPKRLSTLPLAEIIFSRVLEGALSCKSRFRRSGKPCNKVLPPVTTTDPYRDKRTSASHIPTLVDANCPAPRGA
ncbi:hypothetical protein GQX74_013951 [Glossina fuscipes]|nr:hypothetical protein GQX74_013951 [Glossina fuscipes]